MNSDKDIVAAVRAALAERIGEHRYELWFGAETQLLYRDTTLTIRTPNSFFQDWIWTNFRADLEASCEAVLGVRPKLVFEVESNGSLSDGSRSEAIGREEKGVGDSIGGRGSKSVRTDDGQGRLPLLDVGGPHADLSSQTSDKNGSVVSSAGLASSASGGPTGRSGAAAAALASKSVPGGGRKRFADFDSFVVGPSNQLARVSAEMAAMQPGVLSPLVFCGPTGVGKTHLLEAIWTALRRRRPSAAVLYLSAEQFTSSYLEALRGSGAPSFRRKYRGVDVLLIDDLQFFAGKRATQVELLYTIDALQQAGRQLVFAAAAPPRELRELIPDLAARLDSGVVCRIEPPEYETRLKILAQYAARLGFSLPEEVCRFVATHFRRHAWELSGAVCRLHAASCAMGRALTVDFARQVLADMLAAREQMVQLTDIRKAVCEVFQIDPDGLCGPGKERQLSYPRMLAMWLARKYTRAALSEIGEFFGRRSHSTVISAQKQVERWLSQGRPLRWAGALGNPEEAIRQVEQYLRVG